MLSKLEQVQLSSYPTVQRYTLSSYTTLYITQPQNPCNSPQVKTKKEGTLHPSPNPIPTPNPNPNQVKTKKEGIFVMPLERITITRAYVVGSERAPQ